MVRVYNILNDNENRPVLNIQKELDIDGSNISIEDTVDLLNHFFDMIQGDIIVEEDYYHNIAVLELTQGKVVI